MPLETIHNIEKGLRRLLGAPEDLYDSLPDQGIKRPLSEATPAHKELFLQYMEDLVEAYEIAEAWWQDCVDAFESEGHSRKKAIDLAFDKRLAGPASALEVVWFIREYWLSFDEINRTLPPKDRVPPQTALLAWLVDEKRDDYVRLLTCMPYWPIGLDENGNWC